MAAESLNIAQLLRAVQVLERNATVALMYSGLRLPQYRLLECLDQEGQATLTELSRNMHVSRATASVLINELLRLEVVVAIDHPADRRSSILRLTERGRNKLSVARKDLRAFARQFESLYNQQIIAALNAFALSQST